MTWTNQDDAILLGLRRKNYTLEQLAEKFGCSIAAIEDRLEIIVPESERGNPPQPKPVKPDPTQGDTPEDTAERKEAAAKMDALQLVLLDFCKSYELMGEQLGFFATHISRTVTLEQLLIEAVNIEGFRKTLVKPAPRPGSELPPPFAFLLEKLHERYIFIPRPMMVPVQPNPEEPKSP